MMSSDGDSAKLEASLLPAERQLIVGAQRGWGAIVGQLSLSELSVTGKVEHVIRATFVRDLALGRFTDIDPRGIHVTGARIVGELDLNFFDVPTGLHFKCCVFDGPIRLQAARFSRLQFTGCCIGELLAESLKIDGDLQLNSLSCTGSATDGLLRLTSARIGGNLSLSQTKVVNLTGPALHADGATIEGHVEADNFTAFGEGDMGAVRFLGVKVGNQLNLRSAQFVNASGPALAGDALQVGGNFFFDGGSLAHGFGKWSAIRLNRAKIVGELQMTECSVENPCGSALDAAGIAVGEMADFGFGFHVKVSAKDGAVRLIGGQIQQLRMSGALIDNSAGPAIAADGIKVDSDVRLNDGLTLYGNGPYGTLRIPGAKIEGSIGFSEAYIENREGPAISGEGIVVSGDLNLDKLTAVSAGEKPAIALWRADIMGSLVATEANISCDSHDIFTLNRSKVAYLALSKELLCANKDVSNDCGFISRKFDIDGLTYGMLTGANVREWLHLITCHTREYSPSAYRQLTDVCRSIGHDGDARRVLMAQQRDLRSRGNIGGCWARALHATWGWLAGYGYKSGRLVLFGRIVVAANLALCVVRVISSASGSVLPSTGVAGASLKPSWQTS